MLHYFKDLTICVELEIIEWQNDILSFYLENIS